MTRLTRVRGPASALVIIAPGLYMTAAAWGWAGWIVAGKAGWLLAAALGAADSIRLAAAVRDVGGHEPVPDALSARLRHPLQVSSWLARAATGAGIVFVMTVKPPPAAAAAAIAAAAAAGLAASLPAWRRPASRRDKDAAGPAPAVAPRADTAWPATTAAAGASATRHPKTRAGVE